MSGAGAVTHTLQADLSGTAFGGSPTWTDITAYWMSSGTDPGGSPASEPWGRQDQSSTVESSTTSFVLNNADGRFTPGKASSPYYPHVKRRVRMRHTITDGTTVLTVFDGYVDSWTVTVQTNGPTLATVSLTDAFGRLQASTALRSWLIEETLRDAPTSLYPLDEPVGSTAGGDLTGTAAAAPIRSSKYGAGTITFGAATTVMGTSGALSMSSPDYNSGTFAARGSYLSVPNTLPTSGAFSVEVWVNCVAPPTAGVAIIAAMFAPAGGTAGQVDVYINGGGGAGNGTLTTSVGGSTGSLSVVGTHNVCDGNWHQVMLTLSADNKTLTLYLDGVVEGSTVAGAGIGWANPGASWALGLDIEAGGVSHPLNGSMLMFSQYSAALTSARALVHANLGFIGGFPGESTATRWARLLTYRPNLGGSTTSTAGSVGAGDITGQSLGDALTDTATAEGGVIQSNRGLITLIGRTAQRDPATTVTLDASLGQVDLPTTWRDDTQALVNDVTVSRPNGASQRAVNTASTTGSDGVAQTSITANVNTDRDAADMAGWLVAVGVLEHLDSPTLTVNLYARANTALTMAVCALKTYDVVTLTNLPASAPASTMSFQVQGGTYTVGADTFTAELYTTTMPPKTLRADATADAYTKLDAGLKIAW